MLQLCRAIFLNWTPNQDDGDTSQLFETFSTIINSPTQFDPSLLPLARAVIVDGQYSTNAFALFNLVG